MTDLTAIAVSKEQADLIHELEYILNEGFQGNMSFSKLKKGRKIFQDFGRYTLNNELKLDYLKG